MQGNQGKTSIVKHALTWTPVATSGDQTFVTLANPNGWNPAGGTAKPTIALTVFYVGVEGGNGNGATNNATLVADVWSGFETRMITRADGTPMQYWGDWVGVTGNTPILTTAGLIENANGQCNSWVRLFVDVLSAWGDPLTYDGNIKHISTNRRRDIPAIANLWGGGNQSEVFLVKNWAFAANANIPANNVPILQGYTHYNKVADPSLNSANQTYVGGANAAVTHPTSIPAQNNTNPVPAFGNHQVVLINGVLYDPSYGVTYAYAANNPLNLPGGFVSVALDGLMMHVPFSEQRYNFDLDGDGQLTAYWIDIFSPPDVARLDFGN